ncbi:MAG: DUF4080 domain-containing protein [Planctomycetes bacterium]|nr:DUF4080 domain-containing protein [Planctomycetota bacterium]
MPDIVLATFDAKWIHASFGLRCLRANLGDLRERSAILEFDLQTRPIDAAEAILASSPRIVGLGVYVWNATLSLQLARLLKQLRPELVLVIGGPELSYETESQEIAQLADHVIRGEADLVFAELCRARLHGGDEMPRLLDAPPPRMEELAWPYDEYDARDLEHRVVYVEASRGCPFTCEFCLSALEIPVRAAPLEGFLAEMQRLLDRGLRHFKFVDRTFNLGQRTPVAILRFFRERWTEGLVLHFELVPDRLPAALKVEIAAFPPGALHFEVGVQSLDPATNQRIARRQDEALLEANLRWLRAQSGAHVHADLIAGLPDEDLASFARGFDRLRALEPHEIQVGILKRLRGTPLARREREHGLVFSVEPPYEVLRTRVLGFEQLQELKRFARFWDLVANQGRFEETLPLLLAGESAFASFAALSAWLWAQTRATQGIAFHRLAELLLRWLVEVRGVPSADAGTALARDYLRLGKHDGPPALRPWLRQLSDAGASSARSSRPLLARAAKRQARRGVERGNDASDAEP